VFLPPPGGVLPHNATQYTVRHRPAAIARVSRICRSRAVRSLQAASRSWPELQIRSLQLEREESPPRGLAYLKRSCHAIPIRIRRFEFHMPSQAVEMSQAMMPVSRWNDAPRSRRLAV
jgi:hypothetical protein